MSISTSFPGGPGPVQQGKYAEFSMDGSNHVSSGWNQNTTDGGICGVKIEFWYKDTGDFEQSVFGLAPMKLTTTEPTDQTTVEVLGPIHEVLSGRR